MNKIGYKKDTNSEAQRSSLVEMATQQQSIEELMLQEAEKYTCIAVQEYLHRSAYPFIQGKARDKWLCDRLNKIRQKYILPVF